MSQYLMMVKSLTLWQGAAIAFVALALALFLIQRGVVNTILWLIGIGALGIAVVNKASYG